jgi:hypothetical protein
LELLAREAQPAGELAALRQRALALARLAPETSLSTRPSQAADERVIERSELGQWTAEGLLAQVDLAEAGGGTLDEAALYLKLKALAYLHPEACPALGARLATARVGRPAFRLLAGALGEVGHPAAAEALVGAVRARRNDGPALLALVPTLGGVRSPIPLAEEAIRELAFGAAPPGIAPVARLALGALARRLASTAPARADRIVDQAVRELRSSTSPSARRLWLLVLGNAASSRALPVVERYAADAAPEVRAAVAAALAPLETSRAERILARMLSADPDPAVRLEAAAAFGARTVAAQSFALQKAAFENGQETSVRLVLLDNLWRARERFPAAAGLVRRAAAGDPSTDVRRTAARLLAGG